MSTSKRTSTVHDLASLRLHPDGSRASASGDGRLPRNSKPVVQDLRGNWVAKDAGGLGRVKQRRSATSRDKDKGKARAQDDEDDSEYEDSEVKDPRAIQRRLFEQDLRFLDTKHPSSSGSASGLVELGLTSASLPEAAPTPTSDLLKCIHYYASTYYDKMDQLRDSSRDYRRDKKRRRLEKLRDGSEGMDTVRPTSSADTSEAALTRTDTPEETGKDDVDLLEDGSPLPGNSHDSARSSKGKPRRVTDMYKIFDGSALMAIAMLLQEHILELASTRIPDGWEESMMRAEGEETQDASNGRRKKRRRGRGRSPKDSSEEVVQTTDDEGHYTDEQTYVPSDENETYEKA